MSKINGSWQSSGTLTSRRYLCGNCGSDITSNIGYHCAYAGAVNASIYICHSCNRPTLVHSEEQVPAPRLGQSIEHLPKDIEDLYAEIRNATAAGAYTAVVLASRKLLMHIAVESGAKPGESFVSYVDYMVDNHFTPPNSKPWVDNIRQLGNDANHEIVIMGQTEAKDILKFIENILRFKYEFPGIVEDTPEEPAEH